MTTILTSDIRTFLNSNDITIKDEPLYKSPKGGGLKELLYGGERLYIVVRGTVYNMKYQIKDKIGIKVSEDVHTHLQNLSESIISSVGINPRTVSYEAQEPYEGFWTRGKLIGHDGTFFTRVYNKIGGSEYEELSLEDCPNSFNGFLCLEVRGIFFMGLPHKSGSPTYLNIEISEIVIEDTEVSGNKGSRILQLLGKSHTVRTNDASSKNSIKKEDSEEFLW